MAAALHIAEAREAAHQITSGSHANVVRLFCTSSSESVGPQNISATAPISAAPAEAPYDLARQAHAVVEEALPDPLVVAVHRVAVVVVHLERRDAVRDDAARAKEAAVARPRLHDRRDRRSRLALLKLRRQETKEIGVGRAFRRRLAREDHRDLAVLADELAHLRFHRAAFLVGEAADVEIGGGGGGRAVRGGAGA